MLIWKHYDSGPKLHKAKILLMHKTLLLLVAAILLRLNGFALGFYIAHRVVTQKCRYKTKTTFFFKLPQPNNGCVCDNLL